MITRIALACKSTVKGTLISSILAASDKHATANNWTIQVFPLYLIMKNPTKQEK